MTPEAYAQLMARWHELCRKPPRVYTIDEVIPRTKGYLKWLEGQKGFTKEVPML